MSAAKYGVEQDFSEAGIIIAPVYASKATLDAAGYTVGGSMAYAGGAFYGRTASAFRELMFRDGAGGADYMPVSDSSGIYQAVAKSTFLSGYVTNPMAAALNANNFKITSLANGTASGDAVSFGQLSAKVGGSGLTNKVALWAGSGTLGYDPYIEWGNGQILSTGFIATQTTNGVDGLISVKNNLGAIVGDFYHYNDAVWLQTRSGKNMLVVAPFLGIGITDPTAKIDIGGSARIRALNAVGTVTTDASGNIGRANHFDYSGVLTANRSMILDSFSFTIDASGASSSPGTMLILKGKETSFTTRFLDYQNESGTTSFRASATSSLVTLEAMNAHGLKLASPSGQEVSINSGGSQTTRWLTDGTLRRPQLVGNPASILQGSEWFNIQAIRPAWSVGTTAGDVRHAVSLERDLIGNTVATITTSSNTIGGANHNYRFDASGGSIANTLGADLDEGVEHLFRCTANGTNTITFNADTANGYIFYIDTVSSTTSTTLVAGGAGGTGITAPYKIYFVRRIGTVIFIS
jgi:hypothetical protein